MGKFDGILICTDLDGTLYKNDKTISLKNSVSRAASEKNTTPATTQEQNNIQTVDHKNSPVHQMHRHSLPTARYAPTKRTLAPTR